MAMNLANLSGATAALFDRLRFRRADFRQTFGTPAGKRVLAELLRRGWVTRPGFDPGNPYVTAYREGQREMALHIAGMIGLSDEDIMRLARDRPEEEVDG